MSILIDGLIFCLQKKVNNNKNLLIVINMVKLRELIEIYTIK